jgi:hypothetical protein
VKKVKTEIHWKKNLWLSQPAGLYQGEENWEGLLAIRVTLWEHAFLTGWGFKTSCVGKREVGGGWALSKMDGKEDGGGVGH